MKRHEIIQAMLTREPLSLWYPMELGGSNKQLLGMVDDGLISCQSRRNRFGPPKWDFYMTEEQQSRAKSTLAEA